MGLKIISATPRQFGRRNTFLRGRIYLAGNPPIPCAVRDLTLAGAQLVVASSAPLPSTFRLLVEASHFEADRGALEICSRLSAVRARSKRHVPG